MLYFINVKKYFSMYLGTIFCFAFWTHIVVLPLQCLVSRGSSVGMFMLTQQSNWRKTFYNADNSQWIMSYILFSSFSSFSYLIALSTNHLAFLIEINFQILFLKVQNVILIENVICRILNLKSHPWVVAYGATFIYFDCYGCYKSF